MSTGRAGHADSAPQGTPVYPESYTVTQIDEPVFGHRVRVIEGGDASRPLLLLIHGLGQKASLDWLPLLPELAERYHVLAFDLPGFGGSDQPDAAYTPERYAELAHWLAQRYAGGRRVNVIGHSLGGAVALYYTYRYQNEVERLLMIDTAGLLQSSVFIRHLSTFSPPKANTQPATVLLRRATDVANALTGGLLDIVDQGRDPSAVLHNETARSLLIRDRSMINAALGLMALDFTPLLERIEVPVWILWGRADPVAPLRSGLALKALLPNSDLTVLDGIGHVPMQDATRQTLEWVTRALSLTALPRPGSAPLPPPARDGRCVRQRGMKFTGAWRKLHVESCKDVKIEAAHIQHLRLRNSDVTLHDVLIDAGKKGTAIDAHRSALTATDLRINAAYVMTGRRSRFDIAAARINATAWSDELDYSRLTASLSYWCDGAERWRLHDLWRLEGDAQAVNKALQNVSDGPCRE